MKLELYTAGVPQVDLSDWVGNISVVSQTDGISVYRFPIQETLESLQEGIPVVLDELCAAPDERIEFYATDEEGLRAFVYKTYQSRLGKGWNVCLYIPSKEAVFLPFDEGLIAKRAAHLYFQEGTSDKVYHLYLTHTLDLEFYTVISRYGRRGRSLQQAEKSFDYRLDEAEREWNRLHHDKIQKGYQVGHLAVPEQLELGLPF